MSKKDIDEKWYSFDECVFCEWSIPRSEKEQDSSIVCDRCKMNDEQLIIPVNFTPIFKSKREKDLEYSLRLLCEVKNYKRDNGKTPMYDVSQKLAWELASDLIEKEVLDQ